MRNQNFIGGRWTSSPTGSPLCVFNPATGTQLHQVQASSSHDAAHAVESAAEAFRSWRKTSGRERATYLRAIAKGIFERREELARLEVLDNGKPLPEALWDIDDAAGCFDYYAELAEELDQGQWRGIELPDARFRSRLRSEPVGVAALIIPWNYPLLMAAWKVAPALAAGATMVLKPSELTPITALELAAIAEEAGLPPGVLNVVTGYGPQVGGALTSHPLVRKIGFTGSVPTGVNVMSAAAQDIKTVSLELGGKSPLIVFSDTDVEAAVEWIMFGIFWNQGQVCSATSRLLVEEAIAPRLMDRLVQEATRIPIGDGLAPGTLLGPLVSEGQHAKVAQAVARSTHDGARLLAGGGRPRHLKEGYFFEPTILFNTPEDSPAWREEIFGPVLSVRTFSTEDEAVVSANNSRYGLAAAVMSADLNRCDRVAAALDAGIVWINCSQPTFTQAPWGGMKQSGIGRELGKWGLESYLEVKQITSYVSSEPWGWYLKP